MKLNDLRSLIRETIEEMAKIATGFKLADDWEEKWDSQPDNIKTSVRFKRIIDYLEDRDTPGTLGDLAIFAKYGDNPPPDIKVDTANVNQQVRYLKDIGVVIETGLVTPRKSDLEGPKQSGVFGRPKLTDDTIKNLGINIIRKFSKGNTDFTQEEKDLITKMYDSFNV